MFLKHIHQYDNDARLKLCESLLSFVAIDGSIDNEEKITIEAIYKEAGFANKISSIDYNSLLNMSNQKITDAIFSSLKECYDIKEKKMILFELLSITLCNGEYHEKEKAIIDDVVAIINNQSNMKEDISLEMADIIKTILVLNKKSNSIVFSEEL